MRIWTLCLALLVAACSTPSLPPIPVTVVGDGEHGVLRAHEVFAASAGDLRCLRASDRDEWAAMCEAIGGALVDRAGDEPRFDDQQFVAVPVPRGKALVGIVVSSEEGVDVITLDIEARDVSATVCLLRLSHRSCQMAIIVRDQQVGAEGTVAVFSGW